MNLPIENAKDREIAGLKEELRRLKLKRARKLRNKDPAEFVHPRDDVTFERIRKAKRFRNATGLAAAILKHGGRQILQSHYDPGPGPEGWVNTPSLTFERDIERAADRVGIEMSRELVQEVALAVEKRVDSRFHTSEDRFRRAINSAAFLVWSKEGGPEPKWWELNNLPEDDNESSEEGEWATDGTDATTGTSHEDGSNPDDEDDDCPPEYYETRDDADDDNGDDEPSHEDGQDDSVDDADKSLDDLEEETSDDKEDDEQ